jgi:hypothetical protein
MSVITRYSERMSSPFSEVRQGARDELLMTVAGGVGVLSVIAAIILVMVATISS